VLLKNNQKKKWVERALSLKFFFDFSPPLVSGLDPDLVIRTWNNVTNLITTANFNNANTTQRFYDIFINNLCLIEVTFVAWKSQWNFFSVSALAFQPRGGQRWRTRGRLEGWKCSSCGGICAMIFQRARKTKISARKWFSVTTVGVALCLGFLTESISSTQSWLKHKRELGVPFKYLKVFLLRSTWLHFHCNLLLCPHLVCQFAVSLLLLCLLIITEQRNGISQMNDYLITRLRPSDVDLIKSEREITGCRRDAELNSISGSQSRDLRLVERLADVSRCAIVLRSHKCLFSLRFSGKRIRESRREESGSLIPGDNVLGFNPFSWEPNKISAFFVRFIIDSKQFLCENFLLFARLPQAIGNTFRVHFSSEIYAKSSKTLFVRISSILETVMTIVDLR
jgi:hypothetical protein